MKNIIKKRKAFNGLIGLLLFSALLLLSSFAIQFQPKENNDDWQTYKTIYGVEHYGLAEDGNYYPYMKDRGEYIIETRVYNGKRQYCISGNYRTRIPVKKSPVKKYNSCACPTNTCGTIWCFNL